MSQSRNKVVRATLYEPMLIVGIGNVGPHLGDGANSTKAAALILEHDNVFLYLDSPELKELHKVPLTQVRHLAEAKPKK